MGGKILVSVLEKFDCRVHLADGNIKDGTFICNKFLNHMKEEHTEKLSDMVFESAWCWTDSVVIFNGVSKMLILNKMFFTHNMIVNIFGSSIYHKPYSVLKSKSQEFHNKKLVF